MESKIKSEVTELHSFFQKWFNGEINYSNLIFQRFSTVLHPDFILITPEGKKFTKTQIGKQIWDAYGSRDPNDNPMEIWVKNYAYLKRFDSIHLVNYEEWQIHGTAKKGRISTALFEESSNNHNNVRWILVHETWLE